VACRFRVDVVPVSHGSPLNKHLSFPHSRSRKVPRRTSWSRVGFKILGLFLRGTFGFVWRRKF